MKTLTILITAATLAWTTWAATAQPSAAKGPQAQKPAGAAGEVRTIKATVEAIDQQTRVVTLKTASGELVIFKASPRVKNLAQVHKGDEVVIRYLEAVAFEVVKAGEAAPGASVKEEVKTAPKGQKPAGMATRQVTLTGTIAAIDKQARTVTLKGPDDQSRTIRVRNPENLERVQVGDHVTISYTEAIAISVEKPGQN